MKAARQVYLLWLGRSITLLFFPSTSFFLNESVLQTKNEVSWNEGLPFILSWLPWNVFESLPSLSLNLLRGDKRPSHPSGMAERASGLGRVPANWWGMRRFWAAPGKGMPRSWAPDPTFRVRAHVSPHLLLGAHGVPWEALAASPSCCHPSQCSLLLMSQGKAWPPGQRHPPHLGTKGFSFPKLEQGRCPWTSSPGMTCTCSGDCWQIHSPPHVLTHLHHFPPGLSFSSITSLCALVTRFPFIATAWAPLGRVGSIKDMQQVSSLWNEKASRNRAWPAQRPGASDSVGNLLETEGQSLPDFI